MRLGRAAPGGDAPDVQFHLLVGIAMGEAQQAVGGADLDAEFLLYLTLQRGPRFLPRLDLAAGELPPARHGLAGGAVRDEHAAAAVTHDRGDYTYTGDGCAGVHPDRISSAYRGTACT